MPAQGDAVERVGATLARLGATVTHTPEGNTLLFAMDGIEGLARQRRGKFRVSFFLDLDPDPAEARQFVADHPTLPIGELQLADPEDGGFLRLLAELPYHQHQQISSCASAARALHAQWLNKDNESDLLATLGGAGIAHHLGDHVTSPTCTPTAAGTGAPGMSRALTSTCSTFMSLRRP